MAPQLLDVAMQAAGFLPRDPQWAAEVSTVARIPVKSMVVHGQSDRLVPIERSQQLQTAMGAACSLTYVHPGGHMVPTASGDFKRLLMDFLADFAPQQSTIAHQKP